MLPAFSEPALKILKHPDRMNEPSDPAAKAEAARARENEARRKARKNTVVLGVAMFGFVFALLSFKLVTGSDPALSDQAQAAQVQQQPQPQQSSGDDGWGWGGDDDSDDEDDSGWGNDQQQSQGQSAPPTTGAS
jgi:hypothetical protein